MAQVTFQNPWVLMTLPLVWLLLVLFAWRRRFKPFGPFLLRLLIAVLVILALAQPTMVADETVEITPQEKTVLLVDQSASLGAVGQQALRSEAARLAQTLDDVTVLFFADQPVLVDDSLVALPEGAESLLNAGASNLADALAIGGQLLNSSDEAGRILLLSDGLPTGGDTLNAASQLARQDIPVDTLLPTENDLRAWHDAQNEVRVVAMTVPPVLRQGEIFDIATLIHSEIPVSITLKLTQGEQILAEDVIALEAGLNPFNFTATADEVGPQRFQAAIVAAAGDDRQLQNNSAAAFSQVYPTPTILVVADELVQGSRFAALLRDAGFEADVKRPGSLPSRLSELEPYAGMVLINVPAAAMELEQMIAIEEFVRSLGRGLLVTGGRESYDLGRYKDTPLADLLPVSLEPPPREERPPVALLLVIDHSGSMLEQRNQDTVTRLTMAKEAAIRATDILGPDDLLGVLMFDNNHEWVVPFQPVSDGVELLDIQQRIARIPGGGGTRILQALEIGLPELIAQDVAAARHAVLLTDGKSFDGGRTIADYDRIVDEATEAGITLSTIAIGTGADQDLLAYLAERGLGRYHFAETPEELPALTISESDILRSDALQEGDYAAAIYAPHPILRGLFSPLPTEGREPAPNLNAYLAMTPKPQAEVALQVGPGDPLLTTWGYGLGRVAAWSSDTGAEWATNWRNWPEFDRFWGQVVGYTLPAPDLPSGLQVDTVTAPDGTVTLIADSLTATGRPIDLARTEATLVTPGGEEVSLLMRQVAPGRYEREVQLADVGAYQVDVSQTGTEDGLDKVATTGFVMPYAAEYALPADNAGAMLLQQIADVTGGRTFSLGQSLRSGSQSPDATEQANESDDLWFWLLLVALILWPFEIALRRWGRLRIQ